VPEPKLVVAVGDCGCNGGIFGESYASCGGVGKVLPIDVVIPGCRLRRLRYCGVYWLRLGGLCRSTRKMIISD
jgi:NADH:ubiquinone oxidoreductase subunit B-like Fe-S oxidoreductase